MGLKMSEILLILAALLLLFGATRLPALGSSLGQAIRNFKKGFSTEEPSEDKAGGKGAGALGGSTSTEVKDAAAQKVAQKQG
ncbi:MAG: twin-arginine translocase TatA/TatE family subunit [Myxococcales bacterium]|nr:twin-arginine translocase TatA/TatE family subunit [Myxococcales bacterium]